MNITSAKLKSLFGQLLPDIAAQLFPRYSKKEQLRIIDGCCEAEHQALEKAKAPIYPGLEETLSVLSKKYPLFIVSNCQAGYIEVFLKATGFGRYFTGHLCPGDTGMPKGDNIRRGYCWRLQCQQTGWASLCICFLRLRQCGKSRLYDFRIKRPDFSFLTLYANGELPP